MQLSTTVVATIVFMVPSVTHSVDPLSTIVLFRFTHTLIFSFVLCYPGFPPEDIYVGALM